MVTFSSLCTEAALNYMLIEPEVINGNIIKRKLNNVRSSTFSRKSVKEIIVIFGVDDVGLFESITKAKRTTTEFFDEKFE